MSLCAKSRIMMIAIISKVPNKILGRYMEEAVQVGPR